MPTEIVQLLLGVLLGLVHLLAAGMMLNRELGPRYAAGPRDDPARLSVKAARLQRAYANYRETFPWFVVAILSAHLTRTVDAVVLAAGWTYLAARALYLPAYVVEVPFARSLIWSVATGAILLIVVRLLL